MAKNEIVLCDSNIFIHLFNGHENVKTALAKIGNENIAVSIITYAEIIYGTKKAKLSTIKDFLKASALLILMQVFQKHSRVLF